jgi:hypothetical protein
MKKAWSQTYGFSVAKGTSLYILFYNSMIVVFFLVIHFVWSHIAVPIFRRPPNRVTGGIDLVSPWRKLGMHPTTSGANHFFRIAYYQVCG